MSSILSVRLPNGNVIEVLAIKGKDGKDGKDGTNGQDGYTPVKGVDYFDGVNGVDGKDGATGEKGADGYTPVKGVDYFTEADKQEIAELVLANMPSAEGVGY